MKRFITALVIVVILLVAFIFICPVVFNDLPFLPQDIRDQALESQSTEISEVEIDWR